MPIEENSRQRERLCVCVAGSRGWEVRLHISFEAHMILSQALDTTLGATGFGVFPTGFFYTLLCPDFSLLSPILTLWNRHVDSVPGYAETF